MPSRQTTCMPKTPKSNNNYNLLNVFMQETGSPELHCPLNTIFNCFLARQDSRCIWHSLEYVFPSEAHTGENSSGHGSAQRQDGCRRSSNWHTSGSGQVTPAHGSAIFHFICSFIVFVKVGCSFEKDLALLFGGLEPRRQLTYAILVNCQ